MGNNEYKGKKVVIFGLGLHGGGLGAAKFFAKRGANVLATDLRTRAKLAPTIAQLKTFPNVSYRLGEHRNEDFQNADIVVKNPGIPNDSPYLKVAARHGATVTSDVALFFDHVKGPVLGVTGTKGKSTTTTLLHELIKKKQPRAHLGGNVRISVLEQLEHAKDSDPFVLELSSFQTETLPIVEKSPHIAVVTSLSHDHLDRYSSVRAYYASKRPIFLYQKPGDYTVLNYDNVSVRRLAKLMPSSRVAWFSLRKKTRNGIFVDSGMITIVWKGKRVEILPTERLSMPGEHNLKNVLAATMAAFLYGVAKKDIKEVLSTFSGIPYRMERVRVFNDRVFFNDTTASVPVAAEYAIKSFPGKDVVLIAGGSEKFLDFSHLGKVIANNVSHLVLMDDKASPRLLGEVKKHRSNIPVKWAKTMKQAVREAYGVSQKGSVILLSPACASFGLFNNEFERGDQFREAVKTLK